LIQLDTTLKITASEVLTNLTIEQKHLSLNNRQQFKDNQEQLAHAGFIARFIVEKPRLLIILAIIKYFSLFPLKEKVIKILVFGEQHGEYTAYL
jgi:hypothetical protein